MARILVIDDENNIRMMIKLALQHVGHTVFTAADGPEGLDLFGNGQGWDLVLLDQRMPGMEGLKVLRTIRSRDPNARVVMITAFGTIDLAVDAMKAGAQDFLRKPFTAEILRNTVQAVLNGSPLRENVPEQRPPVTFSLSTINGYWIDSQPGAGRVVGTDLRYTFKVTNPLGESHPCEVILPLYVLELVKAHADREDLPGGDRFWQALCEEVLANYLWQNSDFPPGGFLAIEDLTAGLRRWVDMVLPAAV